MSLAALYKTPKEADDWREWSFNHAVLHYDIVSLLNRNGFKGKSVVGLDQFCLHPLDSNNLGMWLYQHQVMHNQTNFVLGTTGFNLVELDLRDPDQLSDWINLNGEEHQTFAQKLGAE